MELEKGRKIAELHYGGLDSFIYYFEEDGSLAEVLDLGERKIVRGAKSYFVKDVADEEEFHSRLSSIGNLTDYLKEKVPSFDLSLFYMNSLSSGMVRIDDLVLESEMEELEKRIKLKEEEQREVESDVEAGVPRGREAQKLESKIKEMEEELEKLEEEKEFREKFKREMERKGVGASFLLRTRTPSTLCSHDELEETIDRVLDDLRSQDQAIKQRARKGFEIILEEMDFPALAYSAESVGIIDPRDLEELAEKEGIGDLKVLQEELEKMFVYRAASDIELERRKFEKSGAISQGISALLSRVGGEVSEEEGLPKADYEKLPKLQEDKRLGYMGLALEGDLEKSDHPYLFDFDEQGPQHTMIFGATGSGKTVCAMNLAENALMHDIPVIVFDTTGQWTGFAEKLQDEEIKKKYGEFGMKNVDPTSFQTKIYTPASDVGIEISTNLLSCPEIEDEAKLKSQAREVSSIIESLCGLTKRERNYVRNLISEKWSAGGDLELESFADSLERWADKEGKRVSSLLIKLQEIEAYPFLFSGEKIDIEELWEPGEISVVSLNHLDEDQMIFAAYNLMRELLTHFYKEPDSSSLRLLMVLEESHRFIPGNTPNVPKETYNILERMVREMRRKGVGTVLISQVLTDFKRSLRANAGTKVWMRNSYEGDIERARKEMGKEYSERLTGLGTGKGIVDFADFGRPAFVEFRPPLHSPYDLSSDVVEERMKRYKEEGVEIPSELLSYEKEEELRERVRSIPEEKINALRSLTPEVYEIIDELREEKEIEEKPDEDLLLREVKKFRKRHGKPPKSSDMLDKLGWGWKRVSEAVNSLLEEEKLEKVKDEKDKRVRRLRPL